MVKILAFGSPTCQPCRQLHSILADLRQQYTFDLQEIDVTLETGLPAQYAVTSVPTVIAIHNGRVLDIERGLGPKTKARVQEILTRASA